MLCKNCGVEMRENARRCAACGESADGEEGMITNRVKLCADGKYRWNYDMNLFKNPTVFILLAKIFFFIILGIFAVTSVFDLLNSGGADALKNNAKVFGIILLVMFGLLLISYLIYAAIMNGKYCVIFEMDEKGINHKQIEFQAKKAKKIGDAAAIVGAAAGSLSTVGAGLCVRSEMYSDFAKTKGVKAYPRRDLIKVNGTLTHNQVYALAEDYEFVKQFIIKNCPNLKK